MSQRDAPPAHPAGIVLLDYLEGDLPGPVLVDVRRHLARCKECRRALTELCGAVEEIERLPTTAGVPSHLTSPASPLDVGPLAGPRRWRVAGIATLLAAAIALWAIATRSTVEPGAAAAAHGIPALAARATALGGALVRDAHDPRHAVLLVPADHETEARAAANATTGLRVDVALYAR